MSSYYVTLSVDACPDGPPPRSGIIAPSQPMLNFSNCSAIRLIHDSKMPCKGQGAHTQCILFFWLCTKRQRVTHNPMAETSNGVVNAIAVVEDRIVSDTKINKAVMVSDTKKLFLIRPANLKSSNCWHLIPHRLVLSILGIRSRGDDSGSNIRWWVGGNLSCRRSLRLNLRTRA